MAAPVVTAGPWPGVGLFSAGWLRPGGGPADERAAVEAEIRLDPGQPFGRRPDQVAPVEHPHQLAPGRVAEVARLGVQQPVVVRVDVAQGVDAVADARGAPPRVDALV